MSEPDTIIIDTTDRIFRELADPQAIIADPVGAWKAPLWQALEDSSLTLAWVPEEQGGADVEMSDGCDILRVAGAHAVAVPLAETLLAGWLLAKAGISAPLGPMTIALGSGDRAPSVRAGKLSGAVRGVPFAHVADHLSLVADSDDGRQVVCVALAGCDIAGGPGMAGDGLATVTFTDAGVASSGAVPNTLGAEDVMLMGAAVRAQQMAGALQAVLDLSVEYAKERMAFGRPIAKFQAVQQNLARLAGEAAAAAAAAGSAADTIQHAETFDSAVFLEVAAAKIRTGEAAGVGAAIAHQVHGAMGFTDEHVLHRYTQRLFAWRDDFGSEAEWAAGLGAMVAANGADQLWPLVASR